MPTRRGSTPFFWGYADETGSGEGKGYNFNLPLDRGSGDDVYAEALSAALLRLQQFDPGALVIALGLDAHESDPFKGLALSTGMFHDIARRLSALGLPTLIVQEGGYANPALGENLESFSNGFLTLRFLSRRKAATSIAELPPYRIKRKSGCGFFGHLMHKL